MSHSRWRERLQVHIISKIDLHFPLTRSVLETRVTSFEMVFLRLIHLLAHHPDFSIATQSLQETTKL